MTRPCAVSRYLCDVTCYVNGGHAVSRCAIAEGCLAAYATGCARDHVVSGGG